MSGFPNLLAGARTERKLLVSQMASYLRDVGVPATEREAIRALSPHFGMGDVAALAEDALFEARQGAVATAMVKPKRPRDLSAELRARSFLQRGSLVRRLGGWRFGTARIPDAIVERLLASGDAIQDGDILTPATPKARL
jgi:hypothetical protein